MKRLFLSLLLALPLSGLFAQSLDKAKEDLKANKLMDAKADIDKLLTDPKNQKVPEMWYVKSKIYSAIGGNDQLRAQVPDALDQSFEAMKKYISIDDKLLLLLMQEQYKPMTDIYSGYFQAGAASYNAGKYSEALTEFQGAMGALSFMSQKGWVKNAMDTTSTLYAGISAEKANKRDEAVIYYSKIVDSGITKIGGNDMLDIYKWVADYYIQKKDDRNTAKYLALGEKTYPNDVFWYETELDIARKSGNKDTLFARYDAITAKFPTNQVFFYNYGLELYQYATDSSSGKKPPNSDALVKKGMDNLAKALAIKPDYSQAALTLGQILYNEGVDLQQQSKAIKGTKPDDVKKRTDLRAQSMKKFDEALPYFEKIDQNLGTKGKLHQDEKKILKDSYDIMITIYEVKGAKDKVDVYTNKFNNVDKDH
ncbi:MAG: hypothetical protein ACHQEM_12305 [Chitinophagales bacterium]